MQATSPDYTIIVPVFNEEENLPLLLSEIQSALHAAPYTWQVLFIDDASTDSSLQVIHELSRENPRVSFLAFEKNCGQSAAFAAGFRHVQSEFVITLDADLQNDPADIPRMLAIREEHQADMVPGWRKNRRDTLVKRISSRIANAIRNIVTQENIRDTGCSLKILRTGMARKMPVFAGMHRFIPTLMKMQGAHCIEIPVNHRPRKHGTSKYGTWGRALAGIVDLMGILWLRRRSAVYVIKEKSPYKQDR